MSFAVFVSNGFGYLAISIISFYIFFHWHKKKQAKHEIGEKFGLGGIFFLLLSILNLLWSFDVLTPSREDFILIWSVITVAITLLILVVVYNITNNNHLLYFMGIFLLAILGTQYSLNVFLLFTSAISYLLMLIVFGDLVLFSNFYLRGAGLMGVLYSIISIIMLFFIYRGADPVNILWFFPSIALFFAFFLLYLDVKHCGVCGVKKHKKIFHINKRFLMTIMFIKYIFYMISISLFILLSTVAVHELGHTLTAQFYGCEEGKAIVYDILDMPHSELRCSAYYNNDILTLSGVGLTLILGMIFLFVGGTFITKIGYLILGFTFLLGYNDFFDFGVSKNIIAVVVFFSFIILIIGLTKISSHYIKQKNILSSKKQDHCVHLRKIETHTKKYHTDKK